MSAKNIFGTISHFKLLSLNKQESGNDRNTENINLNLFRPLF